MKYEVIIFDADETLFDFKQSEREAFKNAMLEFKVDYNENYHLPIYHEINSIIWKELEQGLITQEKLKTERFRRLSQKLEIDLDESLLAKAYMKYLAEGSFLYEESLEIVRELSKQYKLIIVTNGLTYVQDKRIRKSKIAEYFEDVIISEEIGASKPDPKIFKYALDRIYYHNKEKVLMVGDSLTSDIQGGVNYGIDTCWYNPNGIVNKSKITPTYEVKELSKLIQILMD